MTTNTEALLREAAQKALNALIWEVGSESSFYASKTKEAINALRQALATHPAPTQPEQDKGGEPVAWRWFNSNGDQVTNWLDFKPSQRGSIESQVSEAGGHVEYAYARAALRPAQAGVQTGWMKAPGIPANGGA